MDIQPAPGESKRIRLSDVIIIGLSVAALVLLNVAMVRGMDVALDAMHPQFEKMASLSR